LFISDADPSSEVPAMSPIGMALLTLLLAATGTYFVSRRRIGGTFQA